MNKKYSNGTATITAVIFTMISLLLTSAYLRYSLSASVAEKYRFAESAALLLAETGINKEAMPVLPYMSAGVIHLAGGGLQFNSTPEFDGFYKDVVCSSYVDEYGRTTYFASAWGSARFKNSAGEGVTVDRKAEVKLEPEDFSKFMYFTNSEEPGGGPYTSGYVSFGQHDTLEGVVHTNGHMRMSAFGCPEFTGEVYAVDGISMGNCDDSFDGIEWSDSASYILYPPENTVDYIKSVADYVFTADDYLWRGSQKDSLIMTEIEFVQSGFKVSQWAYAIPPVTMDGQPPVAYTWDDVTSPFSLSSGGIGVDIPFSDVSGYWNVDSVFLSNTDSSGTNVSDILAAYAVGDTIMIKSQEASWNYYGGVITGKSTFSGGYIFEVGYWTQGTFVAGGFADGESVDLIHKTPIDPTEQFNSFAFYHNHEDDGSTQCSSTGFHHFDFEPPNGTDYVMPETMFHDDRAVIYIKDGQLRVHGEVDGQFTVITDNYTEYRRQDDPNIIDWVWNNIWLIDDILYSDSNPATGQVVYGTPNRLGLVAGGNVIIANTSANGARNKASGEDIIINAALMAMHDSFVAHYWQNSVAGQQQNGYDVTTDLPYDISNPASAKADGRGPFRNPTTTVYGTTSNDLRGVVHLYGSVTQNLRGYMKRNPPGSYDPYWIGYDKNYHYDDNFSDFFPPPHFPATSSADGGINLVLKSYKEVDLRVSGEQP